MSSSRSKNFRRRVDDDDEDKESNTNSNSSSSNNGLAAAKATTNKPAAAASKVTLKEKPKKLLSFAEDEDSETPFSRPPKSSSSSRLSKSTVAHKLTLGKDRHSSSGGGGIVASNVQPQAGQYTKEALLELQKKTKTLGGSRPREAKGGSSETVVVLKGLVKPVVGGKREEEGRTRVEEEDGVLKRDKDDARKRIGAMDIGEGGEEFGVGYPDQAMIDAIRAKRERLRQSRPAAADYISLDMGSNHGEAEGLSDEEPEFQTRIALLGEKVDGTKKGVFEDVDERPARGVQLMAEDDEDEEERKWEEEQVRKALGKRVDDGASGVSRKATAVPSVEPPSYMYTAPHSYVTSDPSPPSIGGGIGGVPAAGSMTISQQAEITKRALQDNMKRLKEGHLKATTSLSQADDNLNDSLLSITELEKSKSVAGQKFVFMQILRDFVSVICDFLQDKAAYIEELEEQMQELHKKRASVVLERRAADNDDEMTEVQAAVDAAISVLGKGGAMIKGGASSTTIAAAVSAAQAAAATIIDQRNYLPVKLDDMGRDLNLQKRKDMERRAKARQHRRARAETKRMASVGGGISCSQMEGESSTDESEDEGDAYKSSRDTVLQIAQDIFSDASEEYTQLSKVKEKFEQWKRLYSGSYRDAYMSLSIPAIFSPYVRIELLKWDPLHDDVDFYKMRWHSLLFDYGAPEDGSDFSTDDPDADLVPRLVEKAALPILHHDIVHCWDMLSTTETKNAVSATSLIITYVPASSEALKELIVSIHHRLAEAVSNIMVPTWSSVVMKAVPNASRIAAYRFGVAVRLMRNICMWKDILAMSVLEKLALDELLGGKILPHVKNLTADLYDAMMRTERIVDSLSGVWAGQAGSSVPSARSRKLQPLVDYVLTLTKTLEKKHASMVESETNGLARRLKKMLVALNEYDEARAISRIFHLKEAL